MKLLMLTLLWIPAQVMAQEAPEKSTAVDPVSSSSMIQIMGGLALIIALIFFLAWLVKKMHLVQNSNSGLIKIVSAISVGQRERIALIQVGDEQILLGLTPGRIDKLHTLEKAVQVADTGSIPATASFQQKFQQLLNKGKPDENH